MTRARQTIVNKQEGVIYVSLEPNPECYELEPGETLTILYELSDNGDGLAMTVVTSNELFLWPAVFHPEPIVLIDDIPAENRSWNFKHR